jgi:hypothetical protein
LEAGLRFLKLNQDLLIESKLTISFFCFCLIKFPLFSVMCFRIQMITPTELLSARAREVSFMTPPGNYVAAIPKLSLTPEFLWFMINGLLWLRFTTKKK